MAHLIDKDALVAEIKSRLHPVVIPHGTNYDDWDRGAESERLHILSFLDTLEVKEVDLEKELNGYGLYYEYTYFDRKDMVEFAKHFFELGLKAQKGE